MSRHKYRAWDEDCEVMYYSDKEYDDCVFGFHEGCVVAWLRETEPQTLEEPAYDYGKPVETEECTGRKDKHGVEIYEGDITERGTGYRQEIKLIRIRQVYSAPPINRTFWAYDIIEGKDEVIGNIHQHPELLKENQND